MDKKLLLFDFDGTVIDNSEGIYASIAYALRKMRKSVPERETLRKFIGPPLVCSYLAFCEDNPENAAKFVSLYREYYAPVGTAQARLYPGMSRLLSSLGRKGFTLAVCSGKPLAFVEKISALLGITDMFGGFFCAPPAENKVIKAQLIRDALAFFGTAEHETLMIGDTAYDIRAAKEAGVESLGVRYGFSCPGELEREGADYIAESVENIYSLVTG